MPALAIRRDLSPGELRRLARFEPDRRASMRLLAIANALEGCPGPTLQGWPVWSGRRCAMPCCATMRKDLKVCTTARARAARRG